MARTGREWQQAPDLPPSHYLDNRIYDDPEIFNEERSKLFCKVWNFVAHESEVADPFDFRTTEVSGIPLVISRGEDGLIRTFINSCSHRGAKVVREPAGTARSFTCAFHLWCYDTKGNCIAITRPEAYAATGVSDKDFGLREIRTEVQHGLVFINFDDDADSLADYVGDALEALEPTLTAEPLEVFYYNEFANKTNWKHMQEVNCELYHEYLHSINRRTGMKQPEYFERDWHFYPNGHATLRGELIADWSKQKGWSNKQWVGKTLPGVKANEYRVIDIWPDTALLARGSGFIIHTHIALAPDLTLIQTRCLAPTSDTADERRARFHDANQLWGPFGRNIPEDNEASKLQEQGMRAGCAPFSIIAREEDMKTQDEITLRKFYEQWSRRMERSTSDVTAVAAE